MTTCNNPPSSIDAAATEIAEDALVDINKTNHCWFIRVKCKLNEVGNALDAAAIAQMQNGVFDLVKNLHTELGTAELHLSPHRYTSFPDEAKCDTSIVYWVIGLPTLPQETVAVVKKILSEWQNELVVDTKSQNTLPNCIIQAKCISRNVLLKQALVPVPLEGTPIGNKQARGLFQKAPGSSPSQVRRQFLQHAMGYGGLEQEKKPTVKLRPAKQVLSRLRHDSTCNLEDYVIGYIDRKAGILEKPASKWDNFEPDDHIAYFKQISQNDIVWDRFKKIDKLL